MMFYALDHELFQALHLKCFGHKFYFIYFICHIKYETAGFLGLIQIMYIEMAQNVFTKNISFRLLHGFDVV